MPQFPGEVAEILLLFDPAQGQHPLENAMPLGHENMGGVLELPLEAGPYRPKVKQASGGPMALPEPMDFTYIIAHADIDHEAFS